jgi:hypothetical protein
LFGPILLIGLGIVLLLSNLDFLDFDAWQLVMRFWPLILIAIGLDILLGRRSHVGSILVMILLLFLLAGALSWRGGLTAGMAETRTIHQALGGAKAAEVHIAAGVSELTVGVAPEGDRLIEGSVTPLRNEYIEESFRPEGDTVYYAIKSEGRGLRLPFWNWGGQGHWNLGLNSTIPLDLEVASGVGKASLNLERLQLRSLEVNSGVGSMEISLPSQGAFQGEVNGGVGEVVVLVPTSLAVRIEANAGIGSVDVSGNFRRDGRVYTSATYAQAQQKVELSVSGGIGSVTIRQVEKQ